MSVFEKQKRLLAAIVITAISSGGLMYVILAPPSEARVAVKPHAPPIQTPGSTVQSNEIWMQQISQEAKLQNKKLEVLEKMVEKQFLKEPPESNNEVAQIRQELEALKQQLNQQNTAQQEDTPSSSRTYIPMIKHTLMLKQARYRVGEYIPSGTHAKAVLLSAVDASVGVNVSADPQPVIMRLLGDGSLPNNAKTHLKRCHIMGAARGDLSSERVFIRLEKMSCVDTRTDTILETDVSGYASGEDGKNGLQGRVVDRSGRMISSAVLAGMLGGASSFLQNWAMKKNENMKVGETGVQTTVLSTDFARSSGTQGVTTAFDKLADYYIKRAEQLQPVVQINAGRLVNIVFSKGSKYGVEYQEKNQVQ